LHFKHATAKDPYLSGPIGESERLVGGRGRGRLKRNHHSVISNTTRMRAAYHCYTLLMKRREMKGEGGNEERLLSEAGDEGNKGKEGGV